MDARIAGFQVKLPEAEQINATPEECVELIRWFSRIESNDERATVIFSARYFATHRRAS